MKRRVYSKTRLFFSIAVKKSLLIIIPPIIKPFMPQIGPAQLVAYLKSKKISAQQWDLNIDFFTFFLSKKRLLKSINKIKGRISQPKMSRKEQIEHAWILKNASAFIENIDWAKKTLKQNNLFNNNRKYYFAINIIWSCLRIISAEFFPTQISLSFLSNNKYDWDNYKNVLNFLNDARCNPYIDFFGSNALRKIKTINPKMIGFSVNYVTQYVAALTFSKSLKKHCPDIHITFGGSYISSISDNLQSNNGFFKYVDSYIVKEGERALEELYSTLIKGKSLENVSSLVFIKSGKIRKNTIFTLPWSKTSLIPDFSGINMGEYFSPKPIIPLRPSTGCYWEKCSFCSYKNTFTEYGYQEADINNFVNAVRKLSCLYNTKHFHFCCDAISPSFLYNFSQLIIKSKIKIFWTTWVRIDKGLDQKTIKSMYKSGCKLLSLGLESANPRVLKLMRKGIDIKHVKNVLKYCHNEGIKTELIVLFGFPGETLKELNDTIAFITNNHKIIDKVCGSYFVLDNKSDIYLHPDEFNVKIVKRKRPWHDLSDYTSYSDLSGNNNRKYIKNLFNKQFLPLKYFDDQKTMRLVRDTEHFFVKHAF